MKKKHISENRKLLANVRLGIGAGVLGTGTGSWMISRDTRATDQADHRGDQPRPQSWAARVGVWALPPPRPATSGKPTDSLVVNLVQWRWVIVMSALLFLTLRGGK